MPIEIFCCYARKDQPLLHELKIHLMPLQRKAVITLWADTDIDAGAEWEEEIEKHLITAQVILLLVSPYFIASDYCYSVEMKRAIERHEQGVARVIPVILRPVYWHSSPFSKLHALPRSAKPITTWRNRDAAWLDVVISILPIIENILAQTNALQEYRPQIQELKAKLDLELVQLETTPDQESNPPVHTPIEPRIFLRSVRNPISITVLIVLAIFVIAGGAYLTAVNHPHINSPGPTATAKGAATVQAIATLNASLSNPYPPYKGALALNNSLTESASGWDTSSSCQFKNKAYYVKAVEPSTECLYNAGPYSNFVYQIQMKFVTGNTCGGIVFREYSTYGLKTNYEFDICTDGSYILSTTSNSVSQLEPLLRGSSLSIQAGIGQANLIAAVVNGTHLDLYINGSRLTQRSVSDNTSSSGRISVVVSSLMNSNTTAEVAFNDVKVWTL